jgi:hypothetical protein
MMPARLTIPRAARRRTETRTLLAFFCLWTAVNGGLFAQDEKRPPFPPAPPPASLEEIFPGLRKRALVCIIEARIVEAGDEIAWQAADSKITISGRPVSLKLAGDNIVMAIQFTPYIRYRNGTVEGYLVIQGQIWVNRDDSGIHYQGIMQSIPVSLGEKIYFLPLGPKKNEDERSIEIFLELRPYLENPSDTPSQEHEE